MLARVVNPSQDDIKSQDNSRSDSLAAGIEHSPGNDQLIGKIKSCPKCKGLTDRVLLDQPHSKSKEKRK